MLTYFPESKPYSNPRRTGKYIKHFHSAIGLFIIVYLYNLFISITEPLKIGTGLNLVHNPKSIQFLGDIERRTTD